MARLRPAFGLALVSTVAFSLGVIVWDRYARSEATVSLLVDPVRDVRPVLGRGGEPLRGCTPLEVEQTLRGTTLNAVDRVACLAVAGKLDRARQLLLAMPSAVRSQAIAHVFNIAHPIADSGDDASAGPIMALVVELWPNNYMAVFHAGMADYALGNDDAARMQLERFLTMYGSRDMWRGRAEQALSGIATRLPLAQRQARFPE